MVLHNHSEVQQGNPNLVGQVVIHLMVAPLNSPVPSIEKKYKINLVISKYSFIFGYC